MTAAARWIRAPKKLACAPLATRLATNAPEETVSFDLCVSWKLHAFVMQLVYLWYQR
jgi:hypothetical protein